MTIRAPKVGRIRLLAGSVPLIWIGVALGLTAVLAGAGLLDAAGRWAQGIPRGALGSVLLLALASALALVVSSRRVLSLKQELAQKVDSERMLSWVADHDPLTGVGNRRTLQAAARELGQNQVVGSLGAAMLFVDLDGFKDVNDRYGHSVGDEVLRVVAARLRAAVRPDDLVTRYGGDEFLILARDIDAAGARSLANRVSAALTEPVTAGGRAVPVGASVGLAQHDAGVSGDVLLREADAAMYRDKRHRAARRMDDQDSATAA